MSRRSGSGDLASLVGTILWDLTRFSVFVVVVIARFIIDLIFDFTRVSPQKKLLQLQPSPIWGRRPDPLSCPQCKQLNEIDAKVCWVCGVLLAVEKKQTVTLFDLVKTIVTPIVVFVAENSGLVIIIVLLGIGLVVFCFCSLLLVYPEWFEELVA